MTSDPATDPALSMFGYDGLARYLDIGLRTAKRWVADGTLPRPDLRIGRIVRWKPSTIDAWVIRQRRGGAK